jgi:hypothetical protein
MQHVRTIRICAAAPLALALALGCGNSSMSPEPLELGDGGFPVQARSTFKTPDDALNIELRTSPAEPIVGPDNEGLLRVFDARTGDPVDGLSIGVTTWMPVMGHKCAAPAVGVKALGAGRYLLKPLAAAMPGACELKISIGAPLLDGGKAESVTVVSPTFDVTEAK